MQRTALAMLVLGASGLQLRPAPRPAPRPRAARFAMCADVALGPTTDIVATAPAEALGPQEVIRAVLAALHRTNRDAPSPYYGFGIALSFLAPTHQFAGDDAALFARYMSQPHKTAIISWDEWAFSGDLIELAGSDGDADEAYQMVSVRASPDAEWDRLRWKLVRDAGMWKVRYLGARRTARPRVFRLPAAAHNQRHVPSVGGRGLRRRA